MATLYVRLACVLFDEPQVVECALCGAHVRPQVFYGFARFGTAHKRGDGDRELRTGLGERSEDGTCRRGDTTKLG